jgi:hypothetical protein
MNQADKDHEAWQIMNQKAQYRELIKAKELGLPHHINQHGDVVIEKKTMTANELADEIEQGKDGFRRDLIVTMLRNQQAEIEALKALNKSIIDDPLQFLRIKAEDHDH